MKKPVHDHEQHDHGEESGCSLQIECWDVVAERVDDTDGDEASDQSRDKSHARTGPDRPAISAFRSGHARGDRGKHQNAIETSAAYEDTKVDKSDCRTCVWLRRSGRSTGRQAWRYSHTGT